MVLGFVVVTLAWEASSLICLQSIFNTSNKSLGKEPNMPSSFKRSIVLKDKGGGIDVESWLVSICNLLVTYLYIELGPFRPSTYTINSLWYPILLPTRFK